MSKVILLLPVAPCKEAIYSKADKLKMWPLDVVVSCRSLLVKTVISCDQKQPKQLEKTEGKQTHKQACAWSGLHSEIQIWFNESKSVCSQMSTCELSRAPNLFCASLYYNSIVEQLAFIISAACDRKECLQLISYSRGMWGRVKMAVKAQYRTQSQWVYCTQALKLQDRLRAPETNCKYCTNIQKYKCNIVSCSHFSQVG